jgi:hypothetical protein
MEIFKNYCQVMFKNLVESQNFFTKSFIDFYLNEVDDIQNLKITIYFSKNTNSIHCSILEIISNNLYLYPECNIEFFKENLTQSNEFDLAFVESSIQKAIQLLNEIKFLPIKNILLNQEKYLFYKTIIDSEVNFFGDERMSSMKCSICLGHTLSKKECNHALCLKCWASLLNHALTQFPLCRATTINNIICPLEDDSSIDS